MVKINCRLLILSLLLSIVDDNANDVSQETLNNRKDIPLYFFHYLSPSFQEEYLLKQVC